MRLNNSSTQVYMALQAGRDDRREPCGDLLFSSTAPAVPHRPAAEPRHHQPHLFVLLSADPARAATAALIVASTNANYDDWAELSQEDYEASKQDLIETTLDAVEKYVPDIRGEARLRRGRHAADLRALHASTWAAPASARSSRAWPSAGRLPEQIAGLYHAGSVGIIMSGWLGAVNYGVIVANDVDAFLMTTQRARSRRPRQLRHEPAKKSTTPFRTATRSCWSMRSSSATDARIVCRKTFRADEWFFAGHYPGYPLVPGVLLCEAAMQAGAILLGRARGRRRASGVPVATRMNDVRFKRMVRPGETIGMEVELTERLADAFFLQGQGHRATARWPCGSSSPARHARRIPAGR